MTHYISNWRTIILLRLTRKQQLLPTVPSYNIQAENGGYCLLLNSTGYAASSTENCYYCQNSTLSSAYTYHILVRTFVSDPFKVAILCPRSSTLLLVQQFQGNMFNTRMSHCLASLLLTQQGMEERKQSISEDAHFQNQNTNLFLRFLTILITTNYCQLSRDCSNTAQTDQALSLTLIQDHPYLFYHLFGRKHLSTKHKKWFETKRVGLDYR